MLRGMRQLWVASFAVAAVLGFARQGSALQIDVTFTETGANTYSVTAVGDVAWEALNFASTLGASFDFATGAGEDFAGEAAFTYSSAGVLYVSITSLGGVPSGASRNVGTLSTTAALTTSANNGGIYQLVPGVPHDIHYLDPASRILGANPGIQSGGSGVPVYIDVIGAQIPEPTTLGMLGVGLAGLAFLRRRTA